MNAEGLDEADLNYWLAWVLGEPLAQLEVDGDRCLRSDGTIVDYLRKGSILDLLRERGLFGMDPNDIVTFNGHADRPERFTAEILRQEGRGCKASGPTAVIAVCRAVVRFAYLAHRSS